METKKLILTVKEYRSKYLNELNKTGYLSYFDDCTKAPRPGVTQLMLRFIDEEYSVMGGAWPGSFGMMDITNYAKYKLPKGLKRVEVGPNEYNYVDCPDKNKLVPYELKSMAQIVAEEKDRVKRCLYRIPYRFRERFKNQLIVTINGEKAQGSELTDEMLSIMLSEMTADERTQYEKNICEIDITCFPTVEFPIIVRIDGVDDGAMEKQFESMDKTTDFLTQISVLYNHMDNDILEKYGFTFTD